MSVAKQEQFQTLVSLIKEVKPGLAETTIKAEDSLVEHLGLDSLDILQLSRKVNRLLGTFDIETFGEGKGTVQAVLDQVNGVESDTAQTSDMAS